jgi:hypothetical protein
VRGWVERRERVEVRYCARRRSRRAQQAQAVGCRSRGSRAVEEPAAARARHVQSGRWWAAPAVAAAGKAHLIGRRTKPERFEELRELSTRKVDRGAKATREAIFKFPSGLIRHFSIRKSETYQVVSGDRISRKTRNNNGEAETT